MVWLNLSGSDNTDFSNNWSYRIGVFDEHCWFWIVFLLSHVSLKYILETASAFPIMLPRALLVPCNNLLEKNYVSCRSFFRPYCLSLYTCHSPLPTLWPLKRTLEHYLDPFAKTNLFFKRWWFCRSRNTTLCGSATISCCGCHQLRVRLVLLFH